MRDVEDLEVWNQVTHPLSSDVTLIFECEPDLDLQLKLH